MGHFFEVELRNKVTAYSMVEPHSHDYYELFFLLEGERRFYVQNEMVLLSPKSFCVIEPFNMHKTEGDSFLRININISSELLSKSEISFLNSCAKKRALKLDENYADLCFKILKEASKLQLEWKDNDGYKLALARSVLYFLQKQNLTQITNTYSTDSVEKIDTLILKMVAYINENYQTDITLKSLSERFFLCKATLCERFRQTMNCSIMKYLFSVRVSKAREFLLTTDKSMEEIAELCGFSSANYFGLVFKKATGLSPLHYRQR